MSGPRRSKKDLGEQSREVMCTMVKDVAARELAWVWVLILGLLPISSVTLDTQLSLSEPWFAPLKNEGDNVPCITGLC